MQRTSLFPLRNVVGPSLPIASIALVAQSPSSRDLGVEYEFIRRNSVDETVADDRYNRYLPRFRFEGRELVPAQGVATLPISQQLPFSDNTPLFSLFALSDHAAEGDSLSRKLSVTMEIRLEDPGVVGGICYCGYPFLPARVDANGRTESNFGLPREIRVTCVPAGSGMAGFIDAETSYSDQQVISHGGLHYLRTDAIRTRSIALHLSDYPLHLVRADLDRIDARLVIKRHFGFIIPYFYVFQYDEGTRYRPAVPSGMLGMKAPPPPSNFKPHSVEQFARFLYPEFDYVRKVDDDHHEYAVFTPSSAVGPHREFAFQNDPNFQPTQHRKGYRECFISDKVKPGEVVTLYLEQAEEYERCIAGMKIELPFVPEVDLTEELSALVPSLSDDIDSIPRETLERLLRNFLGIPGTVNFCEKIRLRVFELDAPEGVSPAALDRRDKYASLLAEREVDELSEIVLASFLEGIRFVRPSMARYFALELTNIDDKVGQFVVRSLTLVQSASVSLHARPTRTQQVQAVHFRIVGANLAEDYAGLGEDGFNFSVERLVAGETKSVLMNARSLLDLLHLGVGKIYGNSRRRSVEFEHTEIPKNAVNFEERRTEMRSAGWRRSELGPSLAAVNAWTGDDLPVDNPNNKFESYTAIETRTHNKLLYPRVENEWNAVRAYFGLITGAVTVGTRSNPVPNNNGVLNAAWRNPRWNFPLTFPAVRGLRSTSVSPFAAIVTIEEFITRLNDGDGVAAMADLLTILTTSPSMILTAGANSSVSVSPVGIGVSLGIVPYPSLLNNATYGSTGNVAKSGSEIIYSYSQPLSHGLDSSAIRSDIDYGVSNRLVTRTAVDGTDDQRIKGAEVMWRGELVDIVSGTIPLNIVLPATAGRMYKTSDDAIRVRLGSGAGRSISVDVWFDVIEEAVKDDY